MSAFYRVETVALTLNRRHRSRWSALMVARRGQVGQSGIFTSLRAARREQRRIEVQQPDTFTRVTRERFTGWE